MEIQLDPLFYRRQFILGDSPLPFTGWRHVPIGGSHVLSAHPDLDVHQAVDGKLHLLMLGYMVDPDFPERTNQEIIDRLVRGGPSFEQLIERTESLGGRWVLIVSEEGRLRLFHDPCGLRQVYYVMHNGSIWCASQASTLATFLGIERDPDPVMTRFIQSEAYEREERSWPGIGSPYLGIWHLPPNHALDLKDGQAVRYWPQKRLGTMSVSEAIPVATRILRGGITAVAKRSKIMLPVTAGWESRTLLAASRDVKDEVFYYLGRHPALPVDHPDVRVPARLLARLGLRYHVLECSEPMDDHFKQVYDANTTMARHLPKSQIIYHHFKHNSGMVNLCGIGSEIARKCVFTHHYGKRVDGRMLARITSYAEEEFAVKMFAHWLNTNGHIPERYNLNLFDFFYWEQRMGNWGAMYEAEQDIAVDEFCPFNNRKLLTTLLMVDERYRTPPDYTLYREMIRHLWADTLTEPINPPTLRRMVRNTIKRFVRCVQSVSHKVTRKPNRTYLRVKDDSQNG